MLQLVPFEGLTGKISAPKILVFIGGERSMLKCQMANKALIDWQAVTAKKSTAKNTNFVWYQPVTQNQRLRTFFSTVDKEFEWQYQITDFNFTGGVKGFMSTLYVKRLKLHGKVSELKHDVFYYGRNYTNYYFCLFYNYFRKATVLKTGREEWSKVKLI